MYSEREKVWQGKTLYDDVFCFSVNIKHLWNILSSTWPSGSKDSPESDALNVSQRVSHDLSFFGLRNLEAESSVGERVCGGPGVN